MPEHLTTRQTAEILGCAEWQVRRLFESGVLPEPEKFAGKRLIRRVDLSKILDALRHRGYVPEPEPVAG